MIKNEIWKEIEGYNGVYFISNIGRVKSIDRKVVQYSRGGVKTVHIYKGTMLKPRANSHGYLYVGLWINGVMKTAYIHRLVVEAFIGPIPTDKEIDHIDCNKRNNSVENLEIVSRIENQKRAYKNGLKKYFQNLNETNSKKIAIIENNKIIKVFDSVGECARYIKDTQNLSAKYETIRKNISEGARLNRIRYKYHYSFI